VLPMLWFRNTWSWGRDDRRPSISAANAGQQKSQLATLVAKHWELGEYTMYCSGADALLFTENETNNERLTESRRRRPTSRTRFIRMW
jgi:hypothetical protein